MESEFVKNKYVNNPKLLEFKLKEKKIQVVDKNLHEIKNEKFLDYTDDFQVIGKLSIGDQIHQTHNRIRNITDCEHYFNAIDQDYKSEGAIFNGYAYIFNTPQYNSFN